MMNSLCCLDASKNFMTTTTTTQSFLGFRIRSFFPSVSNSLFCFSDRNFSRLSVSCSFHGNKGGLKGGKKQRKNSSGSSGGGGEKVKVKEKENVWSVDNELAKVEEMAEKKKKFGRRKKSGKRVNNKNVGQKDENSRVMISGTMLNEVETVLQTQEPVIKPMWTTFSSSVSGIWKGVGAVFSPITAEMDPIEVGKRNEYNYDCYTLSHIELVPSPSEGSGPQIRRKINWVTLNPYGEIEQTGGSDRSKDTGDREKSFPMKRIVDASMKHRDLPTFESFDFRSSDLLEEDSMGMEPGLVFFEDGSYSRGPVDIPVGEFDESEYFLSPTFKFEQCLVKGCHKRLRIVHTIEFGSGGSDIQIMRVAVYEEQWVSPANLPDLSDKEFDLKPFSQRKRIQPSELTGSWKVFEMSATPIYDDETNEMTDTPYVYLSTETLKKRRLPENSIYFGEEELRDMQDASVLWLPGGVTGYVDISKDGVLCIGCGWYSDEGINLVMEREYGLDGKLKDVRCKSEMKRRWSEDSDALSV